MIIFNNLSVDKMFFGRIRQNVGRTIVQAVSRRPVAAETRFRARVSPCEMCDEQSDTGTGFSPSFFRFPLYHSTVAVHTHNHVGVVDNRPVGGRSSET
jgi:hypothetical protein